MCTPLHHYLVSILSQVKHGEFFVQNYTVSFKLKHNVNLSRKYTVLARVSFGDYILKIAIFQKRVKLIFFCLKNCFDKKSFDDTIRP